MELSNREHILNDIIKTLIANGYEVFYSNNYSFDIFAKGKRNFIIKVYLNVDSLDYKIAKDILAISKVFEAIPIIVSVKDSHGVFSDGVLYLRFGIANITPKTFKDIINGKIKLDSFYVRGKQLCYIDNNKLKALRLKHGYSLEKLANVAGITKKCLYEIERGINNPTLKTTERLESILGEKLRKDIDIGRLSGSFPMQNSYNQQDEITDVFKKTVIDKYRKFTSLIFALNKLPFDILVKGKTILLTNLLKRKTERAVKNIIVSERFSKFLGVNGVVVTMKKIKIKTSFPVFTVNEISKIKDIEELA